MFVSLGLSGTSIVLLLVDRNSTFYMYVPTLYVLILPTFPGVWVVLSPVSALDRVSIAPWPGLAWSGQSLCIFRIASMSLYTYARSYLNIS